MHHLEDYFSLRCIPTRELWSKGDAAGNITEKKKEKEEQNDNIQ